MQLVFEPADEIQRFFFHLREGKGSSVSWTGFSNSSVTEERLMSDVYNVPLKNLTMLVLLCSLPLPLVLAPRSL